MGLATGEAAEEEADWYGRPVVEAARLCALAQPGETLLTAVTHDVVGSRSSLPLAYAGTLLLKGLPNPVPTYRIVAADPGSPAATTGRRRMRWIGVAVVVVLAAAAALVVTARSRRSDVDQVASDQPATTPTPSTSTSTLTSTSAEVRAVPTAAPVDYVPRLEARECSAEESEGDPTVMCSTLVVPMDRTDVDGGSVRLPVVRAPSLDGVGNGIPNVVVAAGVGALATSNLRAVSEQVRLALRGEDDAKPSLACPELDAGRRERLAKAMQQAVAEVDGLLAACRDRLASDGVALDHFGPTDVADDVRDLATALEVDQIDLRVVYDTSAFAFDLLKRAPGLVRAVNFNGPQTASSVSLVSQRAEEAWDAYVQQCAAEAACRPRAVELDASLDRLLGELRAAPRVVDVTIAGETTTAPMLLDADRFAFGVWVALSDPPGRQYLADVLLTENIALAATYLSTVPLNGEPYGLRRTLWQCAEGVVPAELLAEAGVAGRWRILVDTMLPDPATMSTFPSLGVTPSLWRRPLQRSCSSAHSIRSPRPTTPRGTCRACRTHRLERCRTPSTGVCRGRRLASTTSARRSWPIR